METVVVLSWCPHSISFERKIITLSEGDTVSLRRALKGDVVSKTNGLFAYPEGIKGQKLSRNHAEISCHDSDVYLRALNRNTFVNANQMCAGERPIRLKTGDVVSLGGFKDVVQYAESIYDSVYLSVTIFSKSSEDFNYFSRLELEYPFFCVLPETPPSFSIQLEHLYSITKDRLDVLSFLTGFGENELDSREITKQFIKTLKTRAFGDLLSEDAYHINYQKHYEFMKNDHVSQFVLSIACCRNRRTKYWFINQEKKLFKLRWFKMFGQEQVDFLLKYKFNYTEVSSAEIEELSSTHCHFFPRALKYFKVPFTEAPTLVKARRVYIQDGFCYVHNQFMYAPVIFRLKKIMLGILKTNQSNLSEVWWDERIRSIIGFVQKAVQVTDRYKTESGTVTGKNIPELCDQSFPLCMKILQYNLTRDHHLRNGGRFQYTLFLKGIGMNLTNSLCFWKTYFTKKIEESVFMKRYSYHIRHAYGLEGKMADYPPQNCADILKAVPGPLEYHGCPFRVLDQIRMKEALHRSGLNKTEYAPILELVKNGAPQDACRKYFELTHGETYPHPSVDHPNIYYNASRNVRTRQKEHLRVKFDDTDVVRGGDNPYSTTDNRIKCQALTADW